MLWVSLILFGIAVILLFDDKKSRVVSYFPDAQLHEQDNDVSAINVRSLMPKASWRDIRRDMVPTLQILGPRANIIIAVYMALSAAVTYYLVYKFLNINSVTVFVLATAFLWVWAYLYLKKRRRIQFEQTFPDALNVLMSAVTAGESLMQAFVFVGENMEGEVGREFKDMGDRLRLGESPEQVLKRSCRVFPYAEYIFFTITIRANLNRGGQLKGILARLIRILVDARTMERKKMAMTSEARISAKIVAAIPLLFAVILSYINPSHIEYILHDPEGRLVLYYVVGSEVLGLFIVWLLVKRVKV
ncbi:type II secretion system F family protein [Vibrio agarivorans]|uniref:Type II secretion system F family protein n=1 Tax=Vibrio agarivorans TaxID=153622 RepID=A0ABT7XX93_9VIBR|nr:type II secretion system F family protein [Vibrio agarivorans]